MSCKQTFFLIEGYLLYRILWFSVIQQQESVIGTPMAPPSQTFLPLPPYPNLQLFSLLSVKERSELEIIWLVLPHGI